MLSRYRGPAAERIALDAYVKLMRAAEAVSATLERGLAARGLTHTQLGVLEALWHVGPMCQRDLAQRVLRSPANMTAVIDGLEARGLLRRERAQEADRRYTSVQLTEEGRAAIAAAFPEHARRLAAALSALSRSEQEALARLCRKLGMAAADTKDRARPGEGGRP